MGNKTEIKYKQALPRNYTERGQLIGQLLRDSMKRAGKKGLDYSLTYEFIDGLMEKQNNECAVTGIPFSSKKEVEERWQPFRASIDRIVPAKGYIPSNVRLVCVCVNIAMHQWGEKVFNKMLVYRAKKLLQQIDIESPPSSDLEQEIWELEFPESIFPGFRKTRKHGIVDTLTIGGLRRLGLDHPSFREVTYKSRTSRMYKYGEVIDWFRERGFEISRSFEREILTLMSGNKKF